MSTLTFSTSNPTRLSFAAGVWRLADPKISLASITALAVATAFAAHDSPDINILAAVVAFLTIFAVEVGKNAVNDLYDFRSGTDTAVRADERSPFSGGKRVLVDGLLTERQISAVAWVSFALAAILGVGLAIAINPWLVILGAFGAVIAHQYTAPPLKLSYRSLGELAVFLMYGPGLILGMHILLTGTITPVVTISSLTMGCLIANVLLLNEFPDERPDRQAGKRTLVVVLGREKAIALVYLLFATAFAIPLAAGFHFAALGSLAGAPFALAASASLRGTRSGPPVRAQALTLATYLASGLGLILASGW